MCSHTRTRAHTSSSFKIVRGITGTRYCLTISLSVCPFVWQRECEKKGEAPNFEVSHSLVLLCSGRARRELRGGPEGRGVLSLLKDMTDTQEKLTEIYVVQIYGGKQKGRDRKARKD